MVAQLQSCHDVRLGGSPVIPGLGRPRQQKGCESHASVGYIQWIPARHPSETLSFKTNKQTNKNRLKMASVSQVQDYPYPHSEVEADLDYMRLCLKKTKVACQGRWPSKGIAVKPDIPSLVPRTQGWRRAGLLQVILWPPHSCPGMLASLQ